MLVYMLFASRWQGIRMTICAQEGLSLALSPAECASMHIDALVVCSDRLSQTLDTALLLAVSRTECKLTSLLV